MIRTMIRRHRMLKQAYRMLHEEAMPEAPDLSGLIMAEVYKEKPLACPGAREPVSFRNWILVGFVILGALSLSSININFGKIASFLSPSLLLPICITLALALTLYAALFIGSHLDELSERFGLHQG